MKTKVLLLIVLLWLHFFPSFYRRGPYYEPSRVLSNQAPDDQNGLRVLLPVYVRLQALQKGNVTLHESMPKNFTDHVATIDSKILAMFVSSNSLGFNLSTDSVGNLWMTANYSLNEGDYISTLVWVSSKTISENLTSLGSVPFPEDYPEDVKTFLNAGTKIQSRNQTIQEIATEQNQTQNNMTQTAKNILDFVNKQDYDPDTTRLLLSGKLNTTDILDSLKDALQVHDTNSSICIERSWYAAAILRAAGIPTRTVTDVRLKTWIQVWLPTTGWVDGETLCSGPAPYAGMFPKTLSTHTPWVVQNSSDAMFPFTWLPKIPFRVANLTFSEATLFNVNEYAAVLSEPVDAELFRKNPTKLSFPVVFEPDIVYAALTKDGSSLTFTLLNGDENASRVLTLEELNSVTFKDVTVSFKPVRYGNFLILRDFAVSGVWRFDFRILALIVGVPVGAIVVWLFWRRRKPTR